MHTRLHHGGKLGTPANRLINVISALDGGFIGVVIGEFVSVNKFVFEFVISSMATAFFECRFGLFEMCGVVSADQLCVSGRLFQKLHRTHSGPITVMNKTKAATVAIKIP